MKLRKFNVNSLEMRELEKKDNPVIEKMTVIKKILDLNWHNIEDFPSKDFKVFMSDCDNLEYTKRHILHTAAKIFDLSDSYRIS